ncbi:hypothetical protein ACFO25_10015 [Paenactinomyces guangxiensis]|uniref:Uncharacterized protein n=1 Tax=Paenactinomyces guangxiensis TaxID=1490290 RepID=A0A7W1WS98_9BACL|nr:hypothetical protein [Paenactinomyces guangxiensis]MBA4495120.1 hypothetical protein [Paenactinomyces guangxiensis]MBH8592196.1 hypothetical protein [Paenactinomyces guangxiensis]
MKTTAAWAEMIKANDPEHQKKIQDRMQREKEEAAKERLKKRVAIPQRLTGRNLLVVLRSLEKQITADVLDYEIEQWIVSDGEVVIRFKEPDDE